MFVDGSYILPLTMPGGFKGSYSVSKGFQTFFQDTLQIPHTTDTIYRQNHVGNIKQIVIKVGYGVMLALGIR